MNFKRYIKEAMLPEKVTRQISLALYDKSGLKKEMDYLIPIIEKTFEHVKKTGIPPEENHRIAQQLSIKWKQKPKGIFIWKHVKDKEWQTVFRQSGMWFEWAIKGGGGGAYSPTGFDTETKLLGGQNPYITWQFPGWILNAGLLAQFAGESEYRKLINDLRRAPETIEHEIAHAMRDLEHATISREMHGKFKKKKVREKYVRGPQLEFYFEVDATVHAWRALKARLGQKKWDSMTVKDVWKYHPRGDVNPRETKELLRRLHREGLLGKRMKVK